MSTTAAVVRAARVAGLHRRATLSLEAIERRRFQLWAVMSAVLAAVSAAVAVTWLWPELGMSSVVTPGVLRLGMLAISGGFGLYVIEKERALQRLTRLLVDERVLRERLEGEVRRLHSLVTAGRAINATLEVERVLDIVLQSALDLVGATGGSISVLGEGASGPVVIRGRAPGIDGFGPQAGPRDRGLTVPLSHEGRLLAILDVDADDRDFTDLDRSALAAFAEHAAVAVGNARLFESERATSEMYKKLASLGAEFRDLAS